MELSEIRRKVGQCFIIGFEGHEVPSDVKNFIQENQIGGVIYMGRNVDSPAQIGEMSNDIQSFGKTSSGPMFISIDMEGGRVHRLKAPFTQWPAMSLLGEIGSASLGFKFAELLGAELLAVGINMNFSPCADVLTNPNNKAIGDRSFGADPELVAKLASAVVRGFVKSGVIPCVKHFPGHGDTDVDSHDELPVVNHDLQRLDAVEFLPFKKAFRARADLAMISHLMCPKLDPDLPGTLSEKIIQEYLRKHVGFRKTIITDDMEMKAITKNYSVEDAAKLAFKAGCNIMMYCHTLDFQKRAMESIVSAVSSKEIPEATLQKSYEMVTTLKKENLGAFKPVNIQNISKVVGHPDHLKLAKQIARKEIPAGLTT